MSTISSNKTIAQNTLFLYFRMLLMMGISFFTARVILNVLGIVDNGIYQVVGGLVTFFSFINNSLAGASSRFLTVDIGKDDKEHLRQSFCAILSAHVIVAVIFFILAETVGVWYVETMMVLPADRMMAARLVYQFSILSALLSITQVPYNASIISHEKMNAFAYISILEGLLRLAVCLLVYLAPFDKLVCYGLLVLVVSVIIQLIYRFYCIRHFEECKFHFNFDKKVLNPIITFAGWDLFGNFSVVARSQGINMIMNLFFGPVINAAVGFSNTIGMAVLGFANNFTTAIRPPIVKSYAIGDYKHMEELMINASKYSFALLLLLSTPFFFESKAILDFWLVTPPAYTDIFCKLELLLSVLSSLFFPLVFAIHASGKIRFMSLMNGSIWLLSLPITYIFLKNGYEPTVPYIAKLGLLVFVVVSNFYSVKHNISSFCITDYLRKGIVPSLMIFVLVIGATYLVYSQFAEASFLRFFTTCATSTLLTVVLSYVFLLDAETKKKILGRGV